jgi:hypothetical protein
MASLNTISAVISAGQSLSSAADASGCTRIARIVMPSDWSGGAPLTFQLSVDNVNFHDLYHVDPSTFYSFEVQAPRPVPGSVLTLPPGLGGAISFVRVRSGTRSLPIPQDADRTFTFVCEMP